VLALVSPLHWLGERLFVAHMMEHEVLMIVGAPLIAMSRPIATILWALPSGARKRIGVWSKNHMIARGWSALTDPFVATALHGFALSSWHMPILYDLVLRSVAAHRLQHICFFVTALLFWYAMFSRRGGHSRYGIALACLFLTSLHSAILGILITLSRQPWYVGQSELAVFCGLTPLEDQQLAGLIMWVPPNLVYLGAALYFAARWIASADTSHRERSPYAVVSG